MNKPLSTVAYIAAGAIPARSIVAFDTEVNSVVLATSATGAMGVSTAIDAEPGQHVDVHRFGFAPVIFGETLTRLQPVTADAQGRAILATAGQFYVGLVEEDGDEDEICSILICPGYVAGP